MSDMKMGKQGGGVDDGVFDGGEDEMSRVGGADEAEGGEDEMVMAFAERADAEGAVETGRKDVKIMAVVGMSGSGKSVVVDYLTEKGYPKVYFGGMILREMEKRGIERTAESEKEFRQMIRETAGNDWVVRQVLAEVRDLIEAGQKRIVLDGLYSWTEYKILKKEFPKELTVVAVVVPKALRHKRVAKRAERPFNAQEIQERDRHEIEFVEKGGPIAMADYYLLNDGTVGELHEGLAKVLEEVGWKS